MNNSKHQTAEERLSTVKQLKDTSIAIAQIKEILRDSPQFIPGWSELGLTYRKAGDRHSALETWETAVKLRPKNPNIRVQLSIEQLHFNKLEDCQENLQQLLKIAPDRLRGIINLGKVYQRKNERERAIELFKKALQIDSQATEATVNLVEQLQKCDRTDEALQYLGKATRCAPKNFNLLICWGEFEKNRRNFTIALEHFQRAIDLYPNRIRARICQINTLWNSGRYDEARSKSENLCQQHQDDFSVLIHAGNFERKLGRRKNALQWHRLAQTKAAGLGQNIKSRILIAQDLSALGRCDEALESIESTIALKPDNLPSLIVKGSILQTKAELNRAAEVYQHILSLKPVHFESRIELAKIYSQLGRVDRAISFLEETYLLLGNRIETFIRLGLLHQALENWESAEIWYQKACQEKPDNYRGYYELANLYFLQGNIEAAFNLLEIAQTKNPDSVQIQLRLIQFQKLLGNVDLCQQLLIELLQRFPYNLQIRWQLCNVYLTCGDYANALNVLAQIDVDSQYNIRRTQQLEAEIYLHQYSYQKAEKCLKKSISLSLIASTQRSKLAAILMLTGRIDEARQQLKTATEELSLRISPGKVVVPLKNNIAMVINQLRINPPLLAELLEAQKEAGASKISTFGRLLELEPNYLGTALYLLKELRSQGIFDKVKHNLSYSSTQIPAIPKRITQFWDEPEPPPEVQKICQSWRDRNPEYEYHRFSLETAIAFLAKNYDERVLQAFANCEHPATQADFFRLAYLSKMGGFYADADDLCRQSLDSLVELNPELVVLQEDFACIGNNFLGCIPGQSIIRRAFEQAVKNLSCYCNESPWFQTGPGLITSVLGSSLAPSLSNRDYQTWPRLLVLSQVELRKMIIQHISLPYKKTDKSWLHESCRRRLKTLSTSA